ncbi:hypothetical protein O7608_01080 [Solwaraspora sp. WMMA2056]|uniref:hypothetical protein n=1 Tax=Solwaraspora sp. WMMA2056 TaxID=3015161 RepID=UPI00259B8F32|nr:hypothetical protein [Solwaraspora sp. WMMA2056]WJK41084.1 hypothetical protein O7608_01080 [Solwaraspora sp. WMMA2056]
MDSSATAEQLAEALPAKLLRAHRVQILDRQGEHPARKRRTHGRPWLLADVVGADALEALAAALRLRPESGLMDWLSWPDCWLKITDSDGSDLITLGVLTPDWLRWEPTATSDFTSPSC